MSYLEIYNELVRDLLQPGATLELREETRGPHAGVVVAGLSRACTRSTHEVLSRAMISGFILFEIVLSFRR
jgi:hypothetical protein